MRASERSSANSSASAPILRLPTSRPKIDLSSFGRAGITLRVVEAKLVVGPVAPVSIYDDKTLRAGDAVMTAKGVRVFLGSHRMPYTEDDFAALSDAEGVPKPVEKALLIIDKAPRT